MAVAIWDRRPSAEELLRARVLAGWRPTATATREGDVILGYAARLVDEEGLIGDGGEVGGAGDASGGER